MVIGQHKAVITLVRLLIDSQKLAQGVDEFSKVLNACAGAWVDTVNIHSECRIWCFADII